MRDDSVARYGIATDRTRNQLIASGWEFNGLFWIDPVSGKAFSEPEATGIMLKGMQRVTNPMAGVDRFLRDRKQ